jgi:hypothetical protein
MPLEQTPQAGMHADNERHHGSDGAHRTTTTRGRRQRPEPVPWAQLRSSTAYLSGGRLSK